MSITLWGPVTWYLFHTLAEKIKDEYFLEEKDNIINMIKLICWNLPCPECQSHAKKNLNNINYNTIISKEDLKNFLYQFHNIVNQQKNKALYPRSKLDEKYKSARLFPIIKKFIIVYNKSSGNIHLTLSMTMNKKRMISKLTQWINKSYYKFNI